MRSSTLTSEQIQAYQRDGFVLLPALFDETEVAEWRREADRLVELTINASLTLGEVSPRLDLQRRGDDVILRKIQPVNDISELFTGVSNEERILEPMRDIFGELGPADPVLMEEKLNYKQILPGPIDLEAGADGDSFPFHTDLHYFYLDGYPKETLSSALSLDETTSENGPMRLLPGSHLKDWPLKGGWPPILEEENIPTDQLVDITGPPGSLLIFHSALVHASSENRTREPRRIMIYSHYPSTHEVEFDKRNRHLREAGQAHEQRARETRTDANPGPQFRLRVS